MVMAIHALSLPSGSSSTPTSTPSGSLETPTSGIQAGINISPSLLLIYTRVACISLTLSHTLSHTLIYTSTGNDAHTRTVVLSGYADLVVSCIVKPNPDRKVTGTMNNLHDAYKKLHSKSQKLIDLKDDEARKKRPRTAGVAAGVADSLFSLFS